MAYKVIRAFRHRNTGKFWRVGSLFDGTEAQARELARKGFVEIGDDAAGQAPGGAEGGEAEDGAVDFEGMTVKELRALCGELGVDAPKKTTKAELIALVAPARAEGE